MRNDYNSDVCIVGLGPAGIGTALTLSNSNLASCVLCLDAGTSQSSRSCSVLQNGVCKKEEPCQMISGFGGCSLLSAGKISTFPAGSKLGTILGSKDLAERKLSEALSLFNNYLPLYRPNIATNDIKNARELFKKLGFEYRYYDAYLFKQKELQKAYQTIFLQLKSAGMKLFMNTKLVKIYSEENGFRLVARKGNQKVTIFTKYLVLGVGRLGRSMLKALNTKLNLGGKENHLDVGVRLEFPTDLYPDITKYHNDLKLLFDDARTFCVCNNGKIAFYLLEGVFFTEGYSNLEYRSGFTNIGVIIRLKASRQNEAIFDEIKKRMLRISNGKPVCQNLSDYLGVNAKVNNSARDIKSSISFWVQGNVNQCFPQSVSIKIKEAVFYFTSRLLPKDCWKKISVFAPELDYGGLSFPIKSDFSVSPEMYLIGDCTGQFRGILQAFCSGIVCAESIISNAYEKEIQK